MKQNLYNIFFLLVVGSFAAYESAEMVSITYSMFELDTDVFSLRYRLAIALICGAFCIFHPKPKNMFAKAYTWLMFYVCAVSLLNMWTEASVPGLLVRALSVLMPLAVFYTFYNISNRVDEKIIYLGTIIACVFVLITFIQTYQFQLLNSLTGDARAGSLYFYLFLLPLFLTSRSKYMKLGAIVFVAGSMVFSLKRGGFISFGLALIVYYLVSIRISNGKFKVKNLIFLVFTLIAIYVVISLGFQTYADEMILRLDSMAEDEGSNRVEVYKATWNMITNSDALSLWFGHGWDSVFKNSPENLSAHNDFLEVIYDFGILALILYLYLYYRIFKSMFILIRNRSEYAPALAFSLITFTVNSTIAHILIYLYNMVIVALVWGYILGKEKQRLKIAIK